MALKRISPGLYYDEEKDQAHLVCDELLAEAGYAPTPRNVELVRKVARELFAEEFPGAAIIEDGF